MTTTNEVIQTIKDNLDDKSILYDGYDVALIGWSKIGDYTVAVYGWQKLMNVLMHRDGMEESEAQEYIDSNIAGDLGPYTPIITDRSRV